MTTATIIAPAARRPSPRGLVLSSVAALAGLALLTGCASGDEPTDSTATPTDTAAGPEPEGTTDAAPAGEPGSATLRINGNEYPDFEGDCDISRGYGVEDVGSLDTPGLKVQIAIDNVDAHPEGQMNFIALSDSAFRFRALAGNPELDGLPGNGALTGMTEIGPRASDGSRDIVEVRFTGTLEDGSPVELDVVCVLQNQY